jgi:hypothetical protein
MSTRTNGLTATHGLPLMLIVEEGVADRGVVWTGGGTTITRLPDDATPDWVDSLEFTKRLLPGIRI